MEPVKVGVIGCGNISDVYFKSGRRFESFDITACADALPERAQAKAREHGIPHACSAEELLGDGEIEIVLNLTTPDAHAAVALAALDAGKSTHGEKPLATTRQDGRRVLAAASEKGLRVGCAPDTFLGAGLQTCRKLIDDGAIGEPVSATAFVMSRGHESWHPAPQFFYKSGGGPMFDMGPYYLTALVNLMGPVRRVTASARITFPERTITSEPKRGEKITVETPTHVAGVLDFASGAVGAIIASFDVWGSELPRIEIYGTEGSMSVPNPNGFGGPVRVLKAGEKTWQEMPLTHGCADQSRGIGVADLACALRSGRPHRASGRLAFHVLDVMQAFLDASEAGRHVEIESTCQRPAALPVGLADGALDP